MEHAHMRKEIDLLDLRIVNLLNERAQVTMNIAQTDEGSVEGSESESQPTYLLEREKQTFDKIKRLNYGPLSLESLCSIYKEILSASNSLEKDVTIAYFGPAGSYTHEAATEQFGSSVLYQQYSTIVGVFDAVEEGKATYGVVPFENSTFGPVVTTLDRLISSTVQIKAETYLPIHHCLLSNSEMYSLRRVYSHPQALGQCAKWLEAYLPGVERIEATSTSQAAQLAAVEPNAAAICNIKCADLYKLNVLSRNIEDGKNNTTRFFILGASSDEPTGDDKTYIMFTVDHRKPGALCDALKVFKELDINLFKIDTRPSHQQLWHYYFLIECAGHQDDDVMEKALTKLENICVKVVVLGSYANQRSDP